MDTSYNNPTEYYNNVAQAARRETMRLSRQVALVSWTRLAVVLLAIGGAWCFWGDTQVVATLIASCVVLFLLLVKLHNRLFAALEMQRALEQVAADNLQRIALDLNDLDGGEEYIDARHPYSYDLDLFGPRSLFALLNATATGSGRELLARNLQNPANVADAIEQRQEAVKELSSMPDFTTRLQALGIVAGVGRDKKPDYARNAAPKVKLQWWQRAATVLFPTAIIALVILAIIGFDVAIYIETAVVASLLTAAAGAKMVGRLHTSVERVVNHISIYHDLLHEIEEHNFSSPQLQELQQRLGKGNEKSSAIMRRLSRLLANLDQRYNWLSYILLNALLQWDYRQACNVARWLERYADKLGEWDATLARIDELCSLATFTFGNPGFVFPKICRDPRGVIIKASGLGHPLIHRDRCVCNDVSAMSAGNFMVVTGANMAGKSTYLRTVGINYLLAMVGAPVFAAEMTAGPASLFTGLRTTDSLDDGESYFFAELRRLQSIVERAAAGERMLIILDEILKGTNSADKQKGSLALVGKLVGMNIAGIIATHDLVLGSLADRFPGRVFNRCFEAEINGDTLHFDYTLRPGIAQNLNAYFLMQHMGIV